MRINLEPSQVVNDFAKELLNQSKSTNTLFCSTSIKSPIELSEEEKNKWAQSALHFGPTEPRTLFDFEQGQIDAFVHFRDVKEDDKKFDFVIADLPFGMKAIACDVLGAKTLEHWCVIAQLLAKLSDDGVGIFEVEPNFGASISSRRFLHQLNEQGYFLQALIEMPDGILAPITALQPSFAIISRKKTEKLFVASLNVDSNIKELIASCSEKEAKKNLGEGDIVSTESFRGFDHYRINKKIERIQTKYKEYEQVVFKDIAKEINSTKDLFAEKENVLYIPKIAKLNDVHIAMSNLTKKHQNYYQVILDENVVQSVYLKRYFMTEMGQLSLASALNGTFISRINKDAIKDLTVPIPKMKTQKMMEESYDAVTRVSTAIEKIQKESAFNPDSARTVIEKMNDVLGALDQLSKEDEILRLIRQGESLTVEFKQTFSKDVRSGGKKPQKEVEEWSLKNIVAFLNKEGGTLLIGVEDSGEIYGIEKDKYVNDDKYLLHFKDVFKNRIGLKYSDLVLYEIVNIDGKKVLSIGCAKSDREVYLDNKHFYVRTNPSAEELVGPELTAYVREHFKS